MPKVTLKHENERFESLMRRFKKAVDRAGTMQDLRAHEFFESRSEERKRKKAAAIKRWHKKLADENNALVEIRAGKRDT